jgi:hypothetical protein
MRATIVLAALLAAAAVAPVAGGGTSLVRPAWLAPVELTSRTDNSVWAQDAALDSAGNALAVWGGPGGVRAAFRPSGGAWQASVQLAACGLAPRVAFDASGTATVAWLQCDAATGAGSRVTASFWQPQVGWSAPVPLSTPDRHADYLRLVVAASGQALLSWGENDGHVWVIEASTHAPTAPNLWDQPVQLSTIGADAYDSSPAIDDTGDAAVGFTRADPAGAIVWVAFKPSGRAWQPAVNLSPPGEAAFYPAVAIRPGGDAVAVWEQSGVGLSAIRSAATGTWSQPTQFPAFYAHDLTVDTAGTVLGVWDDYRGIHAAEMPAGTTAWGPAFDVSSQASTPLSYAVRFDATGALVAVWGMEDEAGNGSVAASRRGAGATDWEAPVILQVPGTLNDLYQAGYGVDAVGDAVAVYETTNGASVGAALLDSAAPRIASLSFRERGRVGRKLDFGTAPVDLSAVRFRWYFGDGRTATGAHVTHTYRKAGRFALTLVATDAAGHTATVARTSVRISSARS